MSKRRDIDHLRALKQEGHDQLDAIAKLGFTRNRIYAELANRLGTSEYSAHFAHMYTERDVLKAIRLLKEIRADWVAERKRKRLERAEQARQRAEAMRNAPEVTICSYEAPAPAQRSRWAIIINIIFPWTRKH